MPDPFEIRHWCEALESFAVFIHERPVKLTTKNTKDTKKFVGTKSGLVRLFVEMRRISRWLIATALVAGASSCHHSPITSSEFATERTRMVEDQLKSRGVRDERVL